MTTPDKRDQHTCDRDSAEAPAPAALPPRSLNGPDEPGPGWDIAVAAADEAVTAFARHAGMDLHHGTRFDIAHEVCCALYAAGCLSEEWPARGPAEAAEPATTGHRVETWNDSTGYGWRCTCGTGGDGLTDRDECAAIAVRHESEAGAPEPAERTVSDGFGNEWIKCGRPECGLEVVRPGKTQCWCDSGPGYTPHEAPCDCGCRGVNDTAAGSVSTTPTPAAMALIDDLLRPWAYGYPVNPGYAGRAAQYVSVATVADWNARRAALAGSTPKENDQ